MAAQGKPEEAIRGLTRSLSEAESSKRLGAVIQLLILRSLAQSRAGATREAQTDVERALLLGEPEGYARVFLDEGQPMQMLLAQWLAHASAGALREYAARLLGQFGAEAEGRATPAETGELMEPLSQRELEVLHLMALGRTNLEIARQLIVARGTVKAHTASIFRKLDVGNRTEAVARARELKILP
jgi:LuxR family maltose regulon positive regulatory protein